MCKTKGDNEYSYTLYALDERQLYFLRDIYPQLKSIDLPYSRKIHDMLCKKKKGIL